MLEDETDGTMRTVGSVAALIVLRLALESAKREGASRSPRQVAGVRKIGGDSQVQNLPGAREGALVGGRATIRECTTKASAVRGPAPRIR